MKLDDVIKDALDRKGLSPAAASQLAFRNNSFVKNLFAGSSPSFANLQKLADVLDLEIYIGPKKSEGDQEAEGASLTVRPKSSDARKNLIGSLSKEASRYENLKLIVRHLRESAEAAGEEPSPDQIVAQAMDIYFEAMGN